MDLDFRLIQEIAGRHRDWAPFWTEVQDRFRIKDLPDREQMQLLATARTSFDGYKTDPLIGKGRASAGGGLFNNSGYVTIGGKPILQGTANFAFDAISASKRGGGRTEPEFQTVERLASLGIDRGGLKNPKGILEAFGKTIKDEVLIYLKEQARTYQAINEQIGLSGELAGAFRDELMLASPDVFKWGISFEEMAKSVETIVRSSGKFKLLSKETIEEMALASKFTESMEDFAKMGPNYERIGLGIRDMSLLVEKMGMKSVSLGINGRETTKIVNENLKQLNAYGFKEGVEGLNRMAQKSIEFRMNMQSVFDVATKVWEPDKALELVANLQVIGGAFGDLNDPIKLMYMATNNVEGLQDALIGAAKGLATYNVEQGRFEITGVNLRRAAAMADELGIKMDELTSGAIAAMEREQALFEFSSKGFVVKDEDKEFLTNLARMEGGKMVIEIPEKLRDDLNMKSDETALAITDMKQEQINFLLSQKKELEGMKMEDYARDQVTLLENIEREASRIRAYLRVNVGQEIADIIDRTLGVNQSVYSKEVSNLGNAIIQGFDENKDAIQQALLKSFPELEKEIQEGRITSEAQALETRERLTRGTENQQAATGTKSTTDVNVNMTAGDAVVDTIKRAIWNDPQWQEDFKRSFLNPY